MKMMRSSDEATPSKAFSRPENVTEDLNLFVSVGDQISLQMKPQSRLLITLTHPRWSARVD
jgi:hypothetical protein